MLVSVMGVNNEIGVQQPLAEIGKNLHIDKAPLFCYSFVYLLGAICRKAKVFFHCDAAQAVGKIPIDVEAMSIDLMSISGHKLYGPKGFLI